MGSLKTEKEYMLGIIKEYFSMSDLDRKIYQLLRRCNAAEGVADMARLSETERSRLESMCRETKSEQEWAGQMNGLIARYV
jgi:hypothetical protein